MTRRAYSVRSNNSKIISCESRHNTWKRPALETSSRASTTTSRVPRPPQRLVERVRQRGARRRSATQIASSVAALPASCGYVDRHGRLTCSLHRGTYADCAYTGSIDPSFCRNHSFTRRYTHLIVSYPRIKPADGQRCKRREQQEEEGWRGR